MKNLFLACLDNKLFMPQIFSPLLVIPSAEKMILKIKTSPNLYKISTLTTHIPMPKDLNFFQQINLVSQLIYFNMIITQR